MEIVIDIRSMMCTNITQGIKRQRKYALCVCMCCSLWMCAQHRNEMISFVPSKEAKKEAKALMKDGWSTVDNHILMEEQIERSFILQNMLMEDDKGSPVSRYIIVSAEAKDKNGEIAHTKARTLCEAQMVQSLQSTINSLIERELKTIQLSSSEARTEEEIRQQTELASKANLQSCMVLQHFIKRSKDGYIFVQMTMALDKTKLTINY